jgi:hypothetical protein
VYESSSSKDARDKFACLGEVATVLVRCGDGAVGEFGWGTSEWPLTFFCTCSNSGVPSLVSGRFRISVLDCGSLSEDSVSV